jgi:hypothetical protein
MVAIIKREDIVEEAIVDLEEVSNAEAIVEEIEVTTAVVLVTIMKITATK